jgi:hypothetical protein
VYPWEAFPPRPAHSPTENNPQLFIPKIQK